METQTLDQLFDQVEKEENASKRLRLKIVLDEGDTTGNPRDPQWNEVYGSIYTLHGRYTIGESHSYNNPDELDNFIESDASIVWASKLYGYEHGGITISLTPFNDQFDSGQLGWAFLTRDLVLAEHGVVNELTIDLCVQVMKAEIEQYNLYLQGEVYGYRIMELDEDGEELDEVDACWGMIGREYTQEQGEEALSVCKEALLKKEEVQNEIPT